QIDHAKLHGVVLQLGRMDDPLPERQQDVSIVQGSLSYALQTLPHRLSDRAHPHAEGVVLLMSLAHFRRGSPDASLSPVEQWDGDLDGGPDLPFPFLALCCRAKRQLRE